jgi:hypothetical protein
MRVWTVLKMSGEESVQVHDNELRAHSLARNLWKGSNNPFELRIYRKRVLRGDDVPSDELLAVYRREKTGVHTHLSVS